MKNFFLVTVVLLLTTAFASVFVYHMNNTQINIIYEEECEIHLKQLKLELIAEKLMINEDSIIYEVSNFINSKTERHRMDIAKLFRVSEYHNIDIRLPMVQGWVESHYGTAGIAVRTNSVFNVGAFDDKTYYQINGIFKYAHVNDSFEPYARLIRDRYLFGERTVYDLLRNFVNIEGNRYASCRRYEAILRSVWNEINDTTNIEELLYERNYLRYQYYELINQLHPIHVISHNYIEYYEG